MQAFGLCSGSSGNSTLIRTATGAILIDAGRSARYLLTAMRACGVEPEALSAVYVTHPHTDHTAGLRVLCRTVACPVIADARALEELMRAGVPAERLRAIDFNKSDTLFGFTVTAFPTPHDAPGAVCYRVEAEGEVVAVATDCGCVTDAVRACLYGADAVLIESNHSVTMLKNGPYPAVLKRRILSDVGHLSNDACAALLPDLYAHGTRHFLLGHLSRENNEPALARRCAELALRDCDPDHCAVVCVAAPEEPICFFEGALCRKSP